MDCDCDAVAGLVSIRRAACNCWKATVHNRPVTAATNSHVAQLRYFKTFAPQIIQIAPKAVIIRAPVARPCSRLAGTSAEEITISLPTRGKYRPRLRMIDDRSPIRLPRKASAFGKDGATAFVEIDRNSRSFGFALFGSPLARSGAPLRMTFLLISKGWPWAAVFLIVKSILPPLRQARGRLWGSRIRERTLRCGDRAGSSPKKKRCQRRETTLFTENKTVERLAIRTVFS